MRVYAPLLLALIGCASQVLAPTYRIREVETHYQPGDGGEPILTVFPTPISFNGPTVTLDGGTVCYIDPRRRLTVCQ